MRIIDNKYIFSETQKIFMLGYRFYNTFHNTSMRTASLYNCNIAINNMFSWESRNKFLLTFSCLEQELVCRARKPPLILCVSLEDLLKSRIKYSTKVVTSFQGKNSRVFSNLIEIMVKSERESFGKCLTFLKCQHLGKIYGLQGFCL